MAKMYPDDKHYRPYPSEHLAVCIDPAYHEQYHGGGHPIHYGSPQSSGSGYDSSSDNDELITIEDEYDGLPRYDTPHPDPNSSLVHHHKHERSLIRDEEVGNIIRVKSKIIEKLAVTLYSNIADRDVYVEMEIGKKYGVKWIDPKGVQTCRGILINFKASQRSTIYQPVNADGYYIVMDCSTPGRSIINNIFIASIRDIVEVDEGDLIIVPEDALPDEVPYTKPVEDVEKVVVIDESESDDIDEDTVITPEDTEDGELIILSDDEPYYPEPEPEPEPTPPDPGEDFEDGADDLNDEDDDHIILLD